MRENLEFFPFWKDLRRYEISYLRRDLLAALSVALMALPQAMAYAFVADLPPSAGIFSAIFGTIFTAAFGSSRFLVSGPSNTVAILIQSGTAEILFSYYRGVSGPEKEILALQIVLQITFLIGLFQIIGGLLNLGRVTQFASRSVLGGYITGAAVAIIITQLYYFLGIPENKENLPLYQQGWFLLTRLKEFHLPTALIGIGCLVVLVFFQRKWQKLPAAIIVFILASFVVEGLALSVTKPEVTLLEDLGPVYTDFPKISLPFVDFRLLARVVPLAFAITILSVLEATAIGRSFAKTSDPPYSDTQEIFGLGISNFFSSFLGAMPSSGSFSRSALNYSMNAKTRFAAIFSGIFLFIIVISLGFLVMKIPLTALSALMLVTAASMINFKQLLLCLKATRTDAFVVIVTFVSTLLFNLDTALYIGIILSIVLYLKQAATPYFVEYTFNKAGKLRALEPEDHRPDPRICIMHVEGELFFGASELLQTKLRATAEDEMVRVIILQMFNARRIDASVCLALSQLNTILKSKGKSLLVSGVTPEVEVVLRDAGLFEEIGEDHFFPANEQLPSAPTRNAYAYAKKLAEQPPENSLPLKNK